MKAKKLIEDLQKIVEEHGDMDVMFDTEARCFDVHIVGVTDTYCIPEEQTGSSNMVVLISK